MAELTLKQVKDFLMDGAEGTEKEGTAKLACEAIDELADALADSQTRLADHFSSAALTGLAQAQVEPEQAAQLAMRYAGQILAVREMISQKRREALKEGEKQQEPEGDESEDSDGSEET